MTIAPRSAHPHHGDTLPNGATVLVCHPETSTDNHGIVLCRWKNGEFVTWVYALVDNDGPEAPVATFWGHYSYDLETAAADFKKRVAQL